MNPAFSETAVDSLPTQLGKMAALLAGPHYPASDRAALKRHAPGQPPPLAFYRLWLRHLDRELPSDSQAPAWALLAWGLAWSGGSHQPARALGCALAQAGFSESRLERLLAAPEDVRQELFPSMVRFMAAKGEAFDWVQAARLLLTRDADRLEAIHRRIATDFYRQLQRQGKE